jgi:hypothetical protein
VEWLRINQTRLIFGSYTFLDLHKIGWILSQPTITHETMFRTLYTVARGLDTAHDRVQLELRSSVNGKEELDEEQTDQRRGLDSGL